MEGYANFLRTSPMQVFAPVTTGLDRTRPNTTGRA